MDEKEKELLETMEQEQADVELPKARIAYVMAIVAILCGGNGIGIVAAGLLWKKRRIWPVLSPWLRDLPRRHCSS